MEETNTVSADVPVSKNLELPQEPLNITKCHLCEKTLKHTEVLLYGDSPENTKILVHPRCLGPHTNNKVKALNQVHIFTEPGKNVSPAKALIIKKKVKEIFKAVAIANERKRQSGG